MTECSVVGCPHVVRSWGWCRKHYEYWLRYGDPLISREPKGTPAERLWSKVDKDGPIPGYRPELGPCWVWRGALKRGYGHLRKGGRHEGMVMAHRLAYELLVGPIPEGLEPDHLCRNRSCVKAVANEQGPAHLEIVTHQENIHRGTAPAGVNARKTHCNRGHLLAGDNLYDYPGIRECRVCKRERKRHKQD